MKLGKFFSKIVLLSGVIVGAVMSSFFSFAQYFGQSLGNLGWKSFGFVMPNNPIYLYAVTEPNRYTIYFDGNGSTAGSMSSMSMTYDEEKNLLENNFIREGFTFKGWSSSKTGEVEYLNKSGVKNLTSVDLGEVTLYAQRIQGTGDIEISYTVNYYQENADDTGYTLVHTEISTGIVGELINIKLIDYSGFSLSGNIIDYQKELGLSGRVVNLYYNRNIYLAIFKLENGETLYSFTGKYGSKVQIPDILQQYDIVGRTPNIPDVMPIGGFISIGKLGSSLDPLSGSSGRGRSGGGRRVHKGDSDNESHYSSSENNIQNVELLESYDFAYKYGITTQAPIENANLEGNLTRIEMAKMLSYYAMNVMGIKPDINKFNTFRDVPRELDSAYNSGVTLAYQLGIMGINMPNNEFRPFDLVPRAEFATALSRLLYKTSDGEYAKTDKYYYNHFKKLKEENIMTVLSPTMQEIRGYVMIMLFRSWESEKIKEEKDSLIKKYLIQHSILRNILNFD